MIRAYLIAESIKPGSRLESLRLNLVKVERKPQGNAAPHQPKVWTFIEFEADEDPDRLAKALSGVLDDTPLGGKPHSWYSDFICQDEKFVIFPHRVIRYRLGDGEGLKEAREYARSVGVPPPQADWQE
jgi:hypothetical protein